MFLEFTSYFKIRNECAKLDSVYCRCKILKLPINFENLVLLTIYCLSVTTFYSILSNYKIEKNLKDILKFYLYNEEM